MKEVKRKPFYMNKAQRYLFQISPRNLVVLASRRFGKSEGIIMPRLLQCAQTMPRSAGAIVARTYKQALTRTLPATLHALQRLGYKEGVHYYIGRKAPKSTGFAEPYIKPATWEYSIHWYNGSITHLISQDVPFSSNSLTLDYIIGDEAKTLKRDKLENEVLLANSGLHYFKENPLHTGYTFVSDMPTTNQGKWLFNENDNMDIELLTVLHGLINQYYVYSQTHQTTKIKNTLSRLASEIDLFRKELTLYAEYSIIENLEIVGERYIRDMHRSLTPFIFRTSVLTQRTNFSEGAFYPALNPEKHYYVAFDNSYLNKFRSVSGDIDINTAADYIFDCNQDTDIDYSKPLLIAADTNININWIVVGQADYETNTLNVLKSFWLKHPAMLTEVCKLFLKYYAPLPSKDVIFYYDQTFLQGRSGINAESFYESIIRVLRDNGWNVIGKYVGVAMRHDLKYKEIGDALKGQRGLLPKFNQPNNKTLMEAMERTGTKVTSLGWGKDKSQEKNPDSPDNPVELRTDGTDAFDTLWIGANNFRTSTFNTNVPLDNQYN